MKLSVAEIKEYLRSMPDWRVEASCLCKDFTFADFSHAMKFISALAKEAEELDHHPDWSNSYNKVSISLTTHSAGGLTDNDVTLARLADKIAGSLSDV